MTPPNRAGSNSLRPGAAAFLRGAAVPAAAAALVCAGATGSLSARTNGPISGLIAEEAAITAELRAASDARPAAADRFTGKPRYLIDAVAESGTADSQRFGTSATLLVVGGKDYAPIRLGDRFSSAGSLQPLPAGDRNLALLRAAAPPDVTPAGGWYAATAGLRGAFIQAAKDRGADVEGLLPGMVLGDRGGLDPGLEQAMKNTGLTHLTAVSGANCSYLLAFIFLSARALRMPRVPAVLLALTGLTAFVLLVRPDPSVLRAAVMGGLGALAVLSGRGRLSAALLFLSISVLLCMDPWLCGNYAFILSVCATLGLIVLGPHLVRVLSMRLPRWLAAALAIPIAAQLFCSPVLVLLQPQLPVYSVPANLVAAPVVPAVTIAGMLAVVLVGLAPVLAAPPLLLAAAGGWWVAKTARSFESVPGALVAWPEGSLGVLLMSMCAGASVVGILYLSRRTAGGVFAGWAERANGEERAEPVNGEDDADQRDRHTGARRRASTANPRAGFAGWYFPHRPWVAAGAAASLVLPGGAVLAARALQGEPGQEDEWMVAACDVGQGDGFAIRAGPDSAVVIDAGGEPGPMDACLDRLGVRTVEFLVFTHAHLDHYGGAAGVLSGRSVLQVGYSSADPELPEKLAGELAGTAAPRTRLAQGMAGTAGLVQWEVLWPPAPDSAVPAAGDGEENNASAVLLVTVGGPGQGERPLRVLFTGDAEEEAAAAILATQANLRAGVDVLKVAHHGARNGGEGWIRAVRPSLALISVGTDNEYGHPAPEILTQLRAAGTAVARTDQHGTVVVVREGNDLEVQSLPP
ncbi:ComEC/Rec2 family competence protein [Arthrobacter sp. zg-Y179]|uniref:ComEC/Rec2 family competence protein n=1 Tax=Arthrobacter sp. zg-Y179 TaxID=2894188 RepID=UPI001E49AD95|nr:ComEC/Rec2 family competence protein [Arthrobacter sp. zg-Y179]MCC9174570.1 ComEC/Rec2 family competence protein [Arthrobacter sp. zg-Y179]